MGILSFINRLFNSKPKVPPPFIILAREYMVNETEILSRVIPDGPAVLCRAIALALSTHDKVHVDLSGWNRYTHNQLESAFGGLIIQHNFTLEQLNERLTWEHNLLPSYNYTVEVVLKEAAEALRK